MSEANSNRYHESAVCCSTCVSVGRLEWCKVTDLLHCEKIHYGNGKVEGRL